VDPELAEIIDLFLHFRKESETLRFATCGDWLKYLALIVEEYHHREIE
jgi:hypothetical protein